MFSVHLLDVLLRALLLPPSAVLLYDSSVHRIKNRKKNYFCTNYKIQIHRKNNKKSRPRKILMHTE